MEAYGFYLQNNIATPTRIGLHVKQRDTKPDLTWADGQGADCNVHDWYVATDPWGSDHYPIWFGLDGLNSGRAQGELRPPTGKPIDPAPSGLLKSST
ncbi:hypothetical protein HPB48_013963 [Haemaphysalis longicornis]|uniref:Uncharacterized protein n=1 Tax=Haemaphysalis longicornis TaxID=44386 RepID=A0A9J6GGW6_HAELO|nr:hypothetical protein HPB48_013963 [Haemaphysalis longicornis]